ncbi:MAG: hypothetical protein ABI776_16865, partial [Nocardioidaceae bacterium]
MTPATRRAAVALALAPLVLAGVSTASAAAPTAGTDPKPKPGFSLAISPTRLVVGHGQGGTTQRIKVINGGTSSLHVDVTKRDFAGGRDGSMVLAATAPYSASRWVSIAPTNLDVPAGETRVVTAKVSIPAEPEPGDHQVALVFLVPAGRTSANVKINRGIGTPVYVTAPGRIDDSVTVQALDAPWFA